MTRELKVEFEKRFSSVNIRVAFQQVIDGCYSTALFGPSGCGKTTILRCIAGLELPESGSILWDSETWFESRQRAFMRPQQRQIGFLFQDYALFPFKTVIENITYGVPKSMHGRAAELLEKFRVAGLEKRLPGQLSGGQQQRIALARAVIRNPRLLLLDEPLSALDLPTRTQLRLELRQLLKNFSVPAIIVTHDPLEAVALADQVVVLDKGRILQKGKVEEVFNHPDNLSVARIVGVETVVLGRVLDKQDGMITVNVGDVTLYAVAPKAETPEAYLCIRAEDVTVQSGDASNSSVRNRLKGRITALLPEGSVLRVIIDCGFSLTALITKQAQEDLQLAEGDLVTALIKASAIHVIDRHGPSDS